MQRSKSSSSSSSAGYNGGGYYNNSTAGYANPSPNAPNTATASGYAASSPSPMLNQPAAQPSYPNTAPPGYRVYDRSASMPVTSDAPQPRTLQFDAGGSGGGAGGGYGSGPYAGYGNTQSSNNATSNVSNPYHKSKSSSGGVGPKHILLSLFAITFLVLSGTTLYFRNIMKRTELQLQDAKIFLAEQTREDMQAQQRRKGENYAGGRGGGHEQRRRQQAGNRSRPEDAKEKIKLEAEIKVLEDEVEGFQKSHQDLGVEIDKHLVTLDELGGKKQDLLKKIDHTNNLLENQVEESSKYKAMVDGLDEVEEYMKTREGALWSRIDVLEGKIARESLREAEEWFGPGPHRVVIEIEYPKVQLTNPDSSSWPRITNKFAIEMAPLDLMPHTVNLFLQQVHHGLWDKCQVVSMAKHIFQLGPSYDDKDKPEGAEMDVPNLGDDPRDRPGDPHYDHFNAKGLDKISYQEYSDQFPHDQWTVGLAGRPGGPDFYINKLDNSLIHGPGGQTNRHDLHNEADPCFGKIVEGLETLKDLDTIPVNEERGHALMYPVMILAAHVVVPQENPADGWRVIDRGMKLKQDDDIMPLPEVPHGV